MVVPNPIIPCDSSKIERDNMKFIVCFICIEKIINQALNLLYKLLIKTNRSHAIVKIIQKGGLDQ